jgi:acetylornithine deacetylase/succinyl-diaminopimelate desuccinylase-like protein
MGQASDNAHLVDERIRVLNLERGQKILQKVFEELSLD